MLKSLRIVNGIKYKDRTFNFEKGLTAIVGPNGGGKSLIQEFIRFALFGSAALRCKVSNYPSNMRIELTIEIKGKEYNIVRTLKDCSINGIINGTSACNHYITEILGYNMSVFDIGNAAKQFEINKLGDMKPTERKAAVNQLIGLDTITYMIKELKEKKNSLKSFCEGIELGLTEPNKPEWCEQFNISAKTYEQNFSLLNKEKIDYIATKNTCESLKCEKPTWNKPIPKGDLSNEKLHKDLLKRKENLGDFVYCEYKRDYLDDVWIRQLDWRGWTEPEITEEEAHKGIQAWLKYESWLKADKITCPKCGEVFTVNVDKAEKPQKEKSYFDTQLALNLRRPKCPKPDMSLDTTYWTKTLENNEKIIEVEKQLANLGEVDYDELREYKDYLTHLEKYNNYVSICKEFSEMKCPSDEELENAKSIWLKTYEYENAMTVYNRDIEKYKAKYQDLVSKKAELVEIEKAIEGLNNFTKLVKNSIIPSLSKIAKSLVNEMSNGEISDVTIDEDFNIEVDNKELNLLSGSEKAIANLAIRLALSCVLTRKVFNVFMGDEIDESMSEDRASSTADSLIKLTNQIDQIILISHRHIIADHFIDI